MKLGQIVITYNIDQKKLLIMVDRMGMTSMIITLVAP